VGPLALVRPARQADDYRTLGPDNPLRPPRYVSSFCRMGDHEACRRRPIVRCACWCHVNAAPGPGPDEAPDAPEGGDQTLRVAAYDGSGAP